MTTEAPPHVAHKELEPDSKTAWIFPGQGTQEVGMGSKLYERYPEARDIYDRAEDVLGMPIKEISFHDPKDQLNQTRYTQPAIVTYSEACRRVLEAHKRAFETPPIMTAGHSLGEYNALIASGALSFEDGIRLIKARAEGMQIACEVTPTGLLAVQNKNPEILAEAVGKFDLDICLENTDSQVVIGGPKSQLQTAEEWLKTHKVRSRPVDVSGAFHSRYMEPAIPILSEALDQVEIHESRIPVVANTTVTEIKNADDIREELIHQLTRPVLWKDTLAYFDENGIEKTLEVGEKGILSNMNKAVIGGAAVGAIATATGIAAAILWHKHHKE